VPDHWRPTRTSHEVYELYRAEQPRTRSLPNAVYTAESNPSDELQALDAMNEYAGPARTLGNFEPACPTAKIALNVVRTTAEP
jgi:hypothetical protein